MTNNTYVEDLKKFNERAKRVENVQVEFKKEDFGLKLSKLRFNESPDNAMFLEDMFGDNQSNTHKPDLETKAKSKDIEDIKNKNERDAVNIKSAIIGENKNVVEPISQTVTIRTNITPINNVVNKESNINESDNTPDMCDDIVVADELENNINVASDSNFEIPPPIIFEGMQTSGANSNRQKDMITKEVENKEQHKDELNKKHEKHGWFFGKKKQPNLEETQPQQVSIKSEKEEKLNSLFSSEALEILNKIDSEYRSEKTRK